MLDALMGAGMVAAVPATLLGLTLHFRKKARMIYVESPGTERFREILEFAKKYPHSTNLYHFRIKSGRDREMVKLAIQKLAADYGVVVHIEQRHLPGTVNQVLQLHTNRKLAVRPKV